MSEKWRPLAAQKAVSRRLGHVQGLSASAVDSEQLSHTGTSLWLQGCGCVQFESEGVFGRELPPVD